MKKLIDYQVVYRNELSAFAIEVKELGSKGYVPCGGMTVTGIGFSLYHQAMGLYEDQSITLDRQDEIKEKFSPVVKEREFVAFPVESLQIKAEEVVPALIVTEEPMVIKKRGRPKQS